MKFVKSLLLGSAAGLVAVSGAQAADLPAKAKAVEYVKICDAYGAGYYFIPGTDICLKVGGYVRADYYSNYAGATAPTTATGWYFYRQDGGVSYDREDHLTAFRSRGAVDLDARTRTEYGTLRSYARLYVTFDSLGTQAGTFGGLSPAFDRAFIQFAGFTFGYLQSFFDFSTGLGTFATINAGSNKLTNVFAYTASLGNGVSVTVAAEDPSFRNAGIQTNAMTVAPAPAAVTGALSTIQVTATEGTLADAGHAMPDIVANIRVDQSWGAAQLSGAVHQLRANNGIIQAGITSSSYDTSYGWALGGGVTFNLDWIAKGDQFTIQGSYADGAIEYAGVSANSQGAGRAGLGIFRGVTGAVVDIADAFVDVWGNLQTVEAWTVRADFRHFWTPTLRSTIFGGYTAVEVPEVCSAVNALGACINTFTNSNINNATRNRTARDFDIWHIGFNTTWSPVRNLDIGVEVLYSKIDVGGVFASGTAADPRAYYTFDEDIFAGMLRVQRNF